MAAVKLTKTVLERMQPGDLVRDNVVRGLFAQKGEGAVSLKIQADLRHGQRNGAARKPISIRMTLGQFPTLTLDAARNEAQRLLATIKSGTDPRTAPTAVEGEWTVARMRDEYLADLEIREKAARTASDLNYLFEHYLADWLPRPIGDITGPVARAKHSHISEQHGKVAANKALKAFRTTFNFAKRVCPASLGDNPAEAVTYNPQRSREAVILFPDLPSWLRKVRALRNPLRAAMHELGLFSGLRPGTLVSLERAWLRLDERAIVIPAERMKARREHALPLSGHMVELVRRALAAGDVLFPAGSPYLFPTREQDSKRRKQRVVGEPQIVATAVWKEKTLPAETGHILRHTFSSLANAAGVTSVNRQLLLGQKVPGIEGIYLQERALFASLLAEQEKITAHILGLVAPAAPAAGI